MEKKLRSSNHILGQGGARLQTEKEANLHRFFRRRIVLVAFSVIILVSVEVYAHTYVSLHGLPVVSEEEVKTEFSNPQYYTGSSALASDGCRWLVGWLVRRPAPSAGYVSIYKTQQNGSLFALSTDLLILDLEATSNNTNYFWAHMDKIDYESNYTTIRIDYELGEMGTYQIDFALHVRVYERTLLGLILKEDITIPIKATVYYGP